MRDFDRNKPSPSPEEIVLHRGSGVYPIRERLAEEKVSPKSDEATENELTEIAELAQRARVVIEAQGGTFNGVVEKTVERRDQEWMGSSVAVAVLYALAHLE